jgi:anti-anti-sigma regulatory factor/tetratricopeptide (TPR) repeat protein
MQTEPLAATSAAPYDAFAQAAALVAEARTMLTRDSGRTLALAEDAAALLANADQHGQADGLALAAITLQVQALYQLGRLAETIPLGQAGLAHVRDERPTQDMFGLLSRLTWVYADLGQFEVAMSLNRRAFDLARRAGNRAWEALGYSDLGVIYHRWGRADESQAATLQITAPELFGALSGDDKALACNNISESYLELGDAQTALSYADTGLAEVRTGFLLACRAAALVALGRLDEAEESYTQAVALAREVGDFFDEQAGLCGLAELLQRQGRSAEAIARAGEALAVVASAPTLLLPCLDLLARLHAEIGDHRSAYTYLRQAEQARESVHIEQADLRARAIEIQLRAEMTQREAAMARHEQESLREQNALLYGLVSERDEALATQQQLVQTIMEISTPVLPLAAGVLALPLIGSIDARRAAQMSEIALASVQRYGARVMLIDITGVQMLELSSAASLLRIARSVRLLGCRVVLVGVRPEIAQSLVGIGADLSELITRGSLADGLAVALAIVGRRIVGA